METKRLILLGVLALALVFSGCVQQEGQQTERAPVPVKIAKVTKGNIQATLAFSGELQPLDQVEIVPSTSGRLQEVFVEEGATVLAGARLAQLETDTLQAQVRQGEANVLSAQARLNTILRGARPEEIAIAQAQLETQRSRLRALQGEGGVGSVTTARANLTAAEAALASAQAKLDQLQNPSSEDLVVSQVALEAATSNFSKAQAAYEQLRSPTHLDIIMAEAAVEAARAALKSAQVKLTDLTDGPNASELAAAQATVAAAEASLRSAQNTMSTYRTSLADENIRDLLNALAAVSAAREQLARDRITGASADVIAADENALSTALRRLLLAEADAGTFKPGVTAEEIAAAQASVDSATANLVSARAKLNQLLGGPTAADLQATQAAVDSARSNLTTAEAKLERLKNPTATDVFAAQAAMDTAKSQQVAAQKQSGNLRNPTTVDLRATQTTVENAAAQRAAAGAAVSRAEADLQAQEAAVAQAQEQLSLTIDKYTAADVTAATTAVALAEAAADLARIQLNKATLVAPLDAIVASKHVSVGASLSSQTPVFTLISPTMQVVFNTEEGSRGRLRPTLPVSLTVAAFPEKPFQATITSIAPVADPTSRTFRVKAMPLPGQEGLRAGMFANITVTTEARQGVLLVPQDALVQRGQESFVYVVRDDVAQQRKVEVGLRNDRYAQVRSGVEEGEQVVVQGVRTLRPQDRVAIVQ